MDSINSFKGYGKVDEAEERAFRQKTRRRVLIIIVSTLVLAMVIIGAVVGTLVHKSNNDDDDSSKSTNPSATSSAQSIKAVCSATLYPQSCLSSLQNSNTADPEELFKISLQTAKKEMSTLSALPDKLVAKINSIQDPILKAALQDCKQMFQDAMDELDTSISSMQPNAREKNQVLTASKINDIKTWLSSALTNQETCLDGIKEIESSKTAQSILAEMKAAMQNSTEFTSNSLAIVTKIVSVLESLDIPIHRKLLGFVGALSSSDDDFPSWVTAKDRRLLQDYGVGGGAAAAAAPAPAPKPDLVVAKDGSGNFETITEAVNSVKKKNNTRVVIYVKAGTYIENVVVDKAHWNIMIYGDGMGKSIVSGSLNFIEGTPTFSTATFIAAGKGFIAKDMGFKNTAGADKHQAVAFRSGSDQSVFYKCSFDAFQDTLYAHSNRQFYRDCYIIGTIDFIFGNAASIFQNCHIQPRQPMPNQFNTITAQGKKDPNQNTGISIQGCVIEPLGTVTAKTYLGRPWKNFSTTVIMQTSIDAVVDPVGWTPWVTNVVPPSSIFYAEYQNTGPGSSVAKRVTWPGYKSTLDIDQAGKFTVDSFIQGKEWLPSTSVTFQSSL